jgi:5-methylcytosine-specific restriction endonuclease McrA
MNESITELINLLGLSDDDVLRALISVYSPCQPSAIKQAWNNRKNYGKAPESSEIWDIYEKYDFRCVLCGSQYRISLDHMNNNKLDNDPKNLQVLCQSCNRAKQKRGIKNRDAQVKVYKAFMELVNDKVIDNLPNSNQIHKHAKVGNSGGSSMYLVKFLTHRLKQRQGART